MSAIIDKIEEKTDLWTGFYDQVFSISLKINTKSWANDEYFDFC